MAERHCAVCRWARDRVERCTDPAAGRARPARSSRGAAVSGLDAVEVLVSCGPWADTERGGNLNPREAAVLNPPGVFGGSIFWKDRDDDTTCTELFAGVP